jgi:ATP-dependent Lhr-like helicase
METILDPVRDKLTLLSPKGAGTPLVVSREWDSKLMGAFYGPKEDEEAGASLLGQWLSFYGPVSLDFIRNSLGLEKSRLEDLIHALVEDRRVIAGLLVDNGSDTDICDSDNYEILLRLSRSLARPKVDALEIDALPLFLAHYQGLTKRADHIDGLFERLEQLSCLPLSAESWESDILPARISPYHPSFLDTLMQEGGLQWMGFARKHSAFCFKPDMDLLLHGAKGSGPETGKTATANNNDPELESLFDPGGVRHDFSSLLNLLSCDSRTLSERIWNLVWQGKLSNDGFSALRKGIETGYKAPETIKPPAGRRFGRRQSKAGPSFSQWRGSLPFAGYWYKPESPSDPLDEMETEDLHKDRVRLLLDRYGILFREILHKELPQFQWAVLFRSLRLMELSGEILSGQFFKGIPGPQFMLPRAFQKLRTSLPEDTVYFMNAVDPASVCGIPLPAVKQRFPKRLPTTLLVFKGCDLKLVSLGNGNDLLIHAEPGDARMVEYLACLRHLLTRPVKPLRKIIVETINTAPVEKSPYVSDFETVFDVLPDYRKITLYRKPA